MAARLKERYQKEVAPQIAKEFGISNPMAIPRVEENRSQHGNGRGDRQCQDSGYGCGRVAYDLRSKARDH